MSGDSEDPDSYEWQWAHVMWQKHGMRFSEFADLGHEERLAYIASEKLERESPVRPDGRLAKVLIKAK